MGGWCEGLHCKYKLRSFLLTPSGLTENHDLTLHTDRLTWQVMKMKSSLRQQLQTMTSELEQMEAALAKLRATRGNYR